MAPRSKVARAEPVTVPPLLPLTKWWVEMNFPDALTPEREAAYHRIAEGARADMHGDFPNFLLTIAPREHSPESRSPESQYYWYVSTRALAERYIHDSGATLDGIVAWSWGEWDMSGTLVVLPSGPKPLMRADGTPAQTWEEWLAERHNAGERFSFATLLVGLRVIKSGILEQTLAEEREKRKAAEELATTEKNRRKELEAGLPDRTMFPGQMVRYGYSTNLSTDFARLAEELSKGQTDLFPAQNALEVIRAHAEMEYSTSQLANMSAAEVRAMHGVYRLFTGGGDDRTEFATQSMSVDMGQLCQAAGIKSGRAKDRAALFDGVRALARRSLPVALKVPQQDGRVCVVGDRTPIIEVKPVWMASAQGRRVLSESDVHALSEQYARDSDTPWDGPLPDVFVFTLPSLMRRISERLVLRGDVLARLEAGSHAVRGAQSGLNPLDHRLLMEITQRQQSRQRSDDGTRVRSFVDRERVLADHYGPEKLAKWRQQRKFRERATEPYENAVQALIAGGLVVEWTPEYQTAHGELRDVFELAPGVMMGSELPPADSEQEALPFATRKKPGRRPSARKRSA